MLRESETAARQRYAMLLGYLQYENTAFWTRANLLLIANAALLGFAATNLPDIQRGTWESTLAYGAVSLGGFILARVWWGVLKRGEQWIAHWHSLLVELEPWVFNDQYVLRRSGSRGHEPPDGRVKEFAYHAALVFHVLWVSSLFFALFSLAVRAAAL